MKPSPVLLPCLSLLLSCGCGPELGDLPFRCGGNGACPEEYACAQGLCVRPGEESSASCAAIGCRAGQVCGADGVTCTPDCRTGPACPIGRPLCDAATGQCWEANRACESSADCPVGLCNPDAAQCAPGCETPATCPGGLPRCDPRGFCTAA